MKLTMKYLFTSITIIGIIGLIGTVSYKLVEPLFTIKLDGLTISLIVFGLFFFVGINGLLLSSGLNEPSEEMPTRKIKNI